MGKVAKILIDLHSRKRYLVKTTEDSFHTAQGVLSKEDLQKNGVVKSSKGKRFFICNPSFIDLWEEIDQKAQTVNQKDIGMIIAKTGLGKDDVVIDAGAGSGALALMMANICKKVVTYEIKESHAKAVEKNIALCGIDNIELKRKSVYEKIDEKDVDVITLDLPEPWKALEAVDGALRVGGILAVYLPNLNQVKEFLDALRGTGILAFETIELIEREWIVNNRQMRPEHEMLGHTAFLIFCRKIE